MQRSTGATGFYRTTNNGLLTGLAVFRRSASLPAIDAVCGVDLGRPVLSLVAELCEHSLVTPLPGRVLAIPLARDHPRVRSGAAVISGEEDVAIERHAQWYTAWAARLAAHSEGPGSADWRAQAALDAENLRLAMDHLSSRPAEELQLVSDCMVLWHELGHTREGLRRLEAALARAAEADPARSIATANLAWLEGFTDTGRAARDARAAIDLARKSGDVLVEALAWQTLGLAAGDTQDIYDALTEPSSWLRRGRIGRYVTRARLLTPSRPARGTTWASRLCSGTASGPFQRFVRRAKSTRPTETAKAVWSTRRLLGYALLLAGDVAEADRELDSCHADLADLSSWSTTRAVWVALARLAFTQGHWMKPSRNTRPFQASVRGGTLTFALISGTALFDVLSTEIVTPRQHSVLRGAERRGIDSR